MSHRGSSRRLGVGSGLLRERELDLPARVDRGVEDLVVQELGRGLLEVDRGTALLDDRNAAWARTLKARLAVPGTSLFAAGAGHFVGPNSLIARLQALGVRVERVE